MSPPALAVSHPVIREVVRLAAVEAPGVVRVGRAGPPWRRLVAGRPVQVHLRDGVVEVKVVVVARPGHNLPALAADVRTAVGGAIERLLGLTLRDVTVIVDGVGS